MCSLGQTRPSCCPKEKKNNVPGTVSSLHGLGDGNMLLVQINNMKDYWQQDMFCSHGNFTSTLLHITFLDIRSCLVLRDPDTYGHEEASTDPLWHS